SVRLADTPSWGCRRNASAADRKTQDLVPSRSLTMSNLNRRGFIKAAGVTAGATFAISGTKASGRILGANDAIHLAVAGINGRGRAHIGEFGEMSDVRITYLIDPDSRL